MTKGEIKERLDAFFKPRYASIYHEKMAKSAREKGIAADVEMHDRIKTEKVGLVVLALPGLTEALARLENGQCVTSDYYGYVGRTFDSLVVFTDPGLDAIATPEPDIYAVMAKAIVPACPHEVSLFWEHGFEQGSVIHKCYACGATFQFRVNPADDAPPLSIEHEAFADRDDVLDSVNSTIEAEAHARP